MTDLLADPLVQALTAPGGMFELEEVEVRGVPTLVWKAAPPTLLDIWRTSAAHAENVFLVYGDERYTYTEAHEIVAALAAGLASRFDVATGDRIAIGARNFPEWAFSYWAVVALGAVAVPLNAWWTGPELEYAITHSQARVVLADQERLDRLEPILPGLGLAGVVGLRAETLPPGVVAFADVVAGGRGEKAPEPLVHPDDDATILYTSGTTGRPKGAVGTHRNVSSFLWNGMFSQALGAARAAAGAAVAAPSPADPRPTPPAPPSTLLTFPLFHVGGLQSHLIPYTLYGGKLVLMYKWDADEAVDLITREEVSAFSGVPTTAFALLERAKERGVELSSLASMASGATLVPPELVRRIDTQFASRVSPGNGYGLTETSGAVVFNTGPDYVRAPDSVGRPMSPVNLIQVTTPDGVPAADGELGEIWVKGPTVVRGYFRDDAATAGAFTDGWFHTGDVGHFDEAGLLHIVDRIKDVVIRGGENVYSAEVEAAIYQHPDVLEAAIVGLPHPTLGEEVAAVVRLRPGSTADAEAIRRHLDGQLSAFKIPTAWSIRDEALPTNASGKVLKRQLRDELTST